MRASTLPPGPRRAFPGTKLLALRRDPTGFLTQLAAEYGDVVQFKIGPQRVVLLNHPDDIRDVLVTNGRNFVKGRGVQRTKRVLGEGLLGSEGEFHLRQRRLVQPAFHRQRLASYGASMVECALQARARWPAGAALDIHAEMARLTLAVVGRTLFGADVAGEADTIGAALNTLLALFDAALLPLAEQMEWLLPAGRRFRRARAQLDATISRLIAERRATGDGGDLLSILLFAQATDGSTMSDEQVRDEAMTLFLAGHETTANALAWAWYLLAQNPAAEQALHAELARVLGGRAPSFDDLPQLVSPRRVVAEALRLFPPAWVIGRRALADYEVGGYTLPAGTIVLMSQWVTQRDARFFALPTRFEPLRWAPEALAARPMFSYFPFGAGTRQCIGEQFAWMEAVLLLATLAQQWRLSLVPGQSVGTRPAITLRPRDPIMMLATPAHPASPAPDRAGRAPTAPDRAFQNGGRSTR